MKIAFFHNVPTGGAKRVVYEQIKLLSFKHTIDLYTLDKKVDFLDFTKLSCEIFTYNFSKENKLPGVLKRITEDTKIFTRLKNLHKQMALDIDSKYYDLVIVHPDFYTQAPFLLQFLKTKSIYFCEELLRQVYEDQFRIPADLSLANRLYEQNIRRMKKEIDKTNAQSANIILTSSEFVKKQILEAYNRNAFVCPLGVDTSVFKPIKELKKYFLFVGMPDMSTGVQLLQDLSKKSFKVKKMIKIVDFSKGKIIKDDSLTKLYSQSFATLCLSTNEPFGLTALESMACQTPVIALNQGGYKETVVNERTGFLIQNSEELLKKCKFFIERPKRQQEMGLRAQMMVENKFTWQRHIAQLEKYF